MFSWKKAAYCARLSTYAYRDEAGFREVIQHKDITFFDFGGTQAYVLNTNKEYLIVFRGTEPTQMADIKSDLKFKKVKSLDVDGKSEGRVHRGFKAALDMVWGDIQHHMMLKKAHKKKIVVTGHSLGAALATLVAGRLNDPDVELYTYGSPRVGTAKWCKNQKFKHYRFRNNNDIVTRMPPNWIGFKHHGDMMYFDYKEMYATGKGKWYMLNNWIMGTYKGWFSLAGWDSFSDHDITSYYKICKNMMIDNE
jgi:triacylglycerol lipase